MKKFTLFTLTALTLICIGGQTLTVQAASPTPISRRIPSVNTYRFGCDIENIINVTGNCFFENPCINLPENNRPDNTPGNGSTEEILPDDNMSGEHTFIQEVVNLVNEERAKAGLSPLTININVQEAAMVRAKECEQSFSHTRPNGSSFATALKEQNVSYRSAGENIAYGQRTPEEVMKAWMNSSGHRANILNPNFTAIGVGYYENANGTDYWCQLFTR